MSCKGLVLLLTLLVLVACAPAERSLPPAVAIGAPAPAYRSISIDGDSVSLAGERGKVMLLNIWATWCHPCRDELPILQRLHERHAAQGFEVIGVSVDARGEAKNVRAFARDFGLTYPIWLDPDERVTATFLAPGVPATYLIGRDGILLWRHVGPVRANDSLLASALDRALAVTADSSSRPSNHE